MKLRRRPSVLITAGLCSAMLLAGCAQHNDSPTESTEKSLQGTDPALATYYQQELTWGGCSEVRGNSDLECADLTVPVDYDNPDGETTTVVLARLVSTADAPQGSLILNPGGPGGSGVDLLQSAPLFLDSAVQENYNVVSFDPRGVFRSQGITCLDDAELDRWRENSPFGGIKDSIDDIREEYGDVGEACAQNSGELLGHMNTDSVARDMDIMRGVLGDERTHYLGFSYGTQIGSAYASMFPDRVGRFVLDGAVDPSLNNHEVALAQARGFDASLREFVRDCVENNSECFTDGSVDEGLEEVQRILDHTTKEDVTADDGRRVSTVSAAEGVLTPLYSTTQYSALNQALRDAQDGDYTALLLNSDQNHGRSADGTYRGNSTFAFSAVTCVDFDSRTVSDEQMEADHKELVEAAPVFGKYLGYTDAACQQWPVDPVDSPEPASYSGSNEILVVGTLHDPATPYAWAESLTEQLGQARLLTYDGWDHVAYTSGDACVIDAVNTYLIDGDLPPDDQICR